MVKKTTCYVYAGVGLAVGIIAGAFAAAKLGIPRIGKLK